MAIFVAWQCKLKESCGLKRKHTTHCSFTDAPSRTFVLRLDLGVYGHKSFYQPVKIYIKVLFAFCHANACQTTLLIHCSQSGCCCTAINSQTSPPSEENIFIICIHIVTDVSITQKEIRLLGCASFHKSLQKLSTEAASFLLEQKSRTNLQLKLGGDELLAAVLRLVISEYSVIC